MDYGRAGSVPVVSQAGADVLSYFSSLNKRESDFRRTQSSQLIEILTIGRFSLFHDVQLLAFEDLLHVLCDGWTPI